MDIIIFPLDRVVEINQIILKTEPGFVGHIDIGNMSWNLSTTKSTIPFSSNNRVIVFAFWS